MSERDGLVEHRLSELEKDNRNVKLTLFGETGRTGLVGDVTIIKTQLSTIKAIVAVGFPVMTAVLSLLIILLR